MENEQMKKGDIVRIKKECCKRDENPLQQYKIIQEELERFAPHELIQCEVLNSGMRFAPITRLPMNELELSV
jgi:hypothetical protein